jgi:hypothetical protein
MAKIKFYNVKKRASVEVDESSVTKVLYKKTTKEGKEQVRYAFRGVDDGTNLTKFCSKTDWDASSAKEA